MGDTTIEQKRAQVADQCRAVAHMARTLMQICEDRMRMCQAGPSTHDEVLDILGERTAREMEWLGNELNNMDAVTDEDEWMQPVFEAAHEMFPGESTDG